MEPTAPLDYADLLDAFEWVSASADGENSAYVCRATGATYFTSSTMDFSEELPDDIDDGGLYIAVPHKTDLNLGTLQSNLLPSICQMPTTTSADFFANLEPTDGSGSCWSDMTASIPGTNSKRWKSNRRCASGVARMKSISTARSRHDFRQ